MSITKSDLMESPDVWTGEVPGVGEVNLLPITGEGADYIRGDGETVDERTLLARIAITVLADDEGKPMFKRGELAQANKSITFKKLKAIAAAAKEHCGLGEDDIDELVEK